MAWDDNQTEEDCISSTDWNNMVTFIKEGPISSNALGKYYPSTLGKGVSSQVLINTLHSSNSDIHFTQGSITTVGTIDTGVWEGTTIGYDYITLGSISSNAKSSYDWYIASGEKLSTISGSLSDRINSIDGVNGATLSSNFFLITSGNTLWDWYEGSAQKLTTISGSLSDRINAIAGLDGATVSSNFFYIDSGNTLWTWYNNSSQKLSNFVASGEEYSKAYASAQIALYQGDVGINDIVEDTSPQLGGDLDANSKGIYNSPWISGTQLSTDEKVIHNGDQDTYISFTTDNITFHAGGLDFVACDESDNDSFIGNPLGDSEGEFDVDFIWKAAEYDANPLFKIDAGEKFISAQTGIFLDWISGNASNLTGSFDSTLYITSANIIANYVKSANALSNFAHSTNINSRFIGSSTALSKYMQSSIAISTFAHSTNINSRFVASSTAIEKFYPSTLGKSLYDFSSNVQAGTLTYNAVSASALSGSWTAPIYRNNKPTATAAYEGQIIVASGGAGVKSWVYMCVCNDADGYEWIQLGVST